MHIELSGSQYSCHKTRIVDVPLSGMKHLRVWRFLMVVAASGENWENVGCGVITTEQEFSFATASSPDFAGSSTL